MLRLMAGSYKSRPTQLRGAWEDEQRDKFMARHARISDEEAADGLAIRELVEAYAHCADRRDAEGQRSRSSLS